MMRISDDVKLDFQDVLLVPQRSTLTSRKDVDIERSFTFKHSGKKWKGTPVIAANMVNTGTFVMAQAFAKRKMMVALHKHYPISSLQNFFLDNKNIHDNTVYTM